MASSIFTSATHTLRTGALYIVTPPNLTLCFTTSHLPTRSCGRSVNDSTFLQMLLNMKASKAILGTEAFRECSVLSRAGSPPGYDGPKSPMRRTSASRHVSIAFDFHSSTCSTIDPISACADTIVAANLSTWDTRRYVGCRFSYAA